MRSVAIIPARGGSKRIPRKNIKLFCGKPLIAYSIAAALESKCFERIIVSTDDEEIAKIAIKFGAEVPFTRPDSISGDDLGTMPVMKHAVDWVGENCQGFDWACCIYATAPFLKASDISECFNKIQNKKFKYGFAVTTFPYPIQRALTLVSDEVEMLNPEHYYTRSQDLEESFHDAAQFYWGRVQSWAKEEPIFMSRSFGYKLPRYRVQDIDTPEDWTTAELMYEFMKARV